MNYRFDIDEWLPRFPLQPSYGRFTGDFITSPCNVCNNEHLRVAAWDQFEWGPAVPVDIFVMSVGEPPDRHVTKIGGLPYRPAELPWPVADNGDPMTFLGQFDFTDSLDLVGDLPDEVLLVFTPDSEEDGPLESFTFEWYPLGMKGLTTKHEVPTQRWTFDPCYGNIFRTVSYPEARSKRTPPNYPLCDGREIWSPYLLLQYAATQIGSAPFFIQREDRDIPGRILCSLDSVGPDIHKPYPWVNHESPLVPGGELRFPDAYFSIADAGCIYIAINEDGRLSGHMSSF